MDVKKIENFAFINTDDEVEVIEVVEVDYIYNQLKWGQAVEQFGKDCDVSKFAAKIFPEMIVSPTKLRNPNIFKNDINAINQLASELITYQNEKLKAQQERKAKALIKE